MNESFEQWLLAGELKNEPLTQRERTLMKIAYLEGLRAANAEHIQSLDRILHTGLAA